MFQEHGEQLAVLFGLWNELTEGTGVDPANVFRWCWAAMYGLAAQSVTVDARTLPSSTRPL